VVSESGIKSQTDIERLRTWRINAILVGEALVTADDVSTKMKELIKMENEGEK
jgi:indole-3-glycerol phosphate synthase